MTDLTHGDAIPLQDLTPRPAPRPVEAPYQIFLAAALTLAVGGGFMLALVLPIAQALEWDWGARWQELAQAHGQLQLLGFAGLFIAGMAMRLMPRFSGRPLAYPAVARSTVVLIGGGVVIRSLAPLIDNDELHAVSLGGSAMLLLAGSAAFAAVIVRTLLHPSSRAEATAWFFVAGAAALVAAMALNLALTLRAIDDGRRMLPASENSALVSLELHGFVLMFIGGIATRAVATLAGQPRSQIVARVAAVGLALGAAVHAALTLWSAFEVTSTSQNRLADGALLIIAAALLLIVWATGVFYPRANRVAAASQVQFWFVRAAFAWLALSSLLLAWYAVRAMRDGAVLDQFEVDAVRHMLTVGVVTMMIIGMAMLVVPEFAGRRLQHPNERAIVWLMWTALNAAVALRVWPAMEGIGWLGSERYWPIAAAGTLAMAVVLIFTGMFAQSYLEQRRPGWGSVEALAEGHGRG